MSRERVKNIERIGILGGTFDPPHNGHLLLAQAAYDQLDLDRVLFMPVGDPTHKSRSDLTSVNDRVSMTVLALAEHEGFQLDLTDALRSEPHYTVTLLPLLLAEHKEAEFWLIMGSDSLRDLHKWHLPDAILEMCRLAVLPRPGASLDWIVLEKRFPDIQNQVVMLEGKTSQLSSTWLRDNWPTDTTTTAYLPDNIVEYIDTHELYS